MKYLKTFEQQIITELDLSNKNLTELPELPDTLVTLYCGDNQLIELPDLPDTLEYLYCSKNNLTSLPELPETLKELYCSNNKLTELPELPKSLKILFCSNNNLPYNNLDEYKEWVKNNQELIKNYGWIKAHEIFYKMKKYNL